MKFGGILLLCLVLATNLHVLANNPQPEDIIDLSNSQDNPGLSQMSSAITSVLQQQLPAGYTRMLTLWEGFAANAYSIEATGTTATSIYNTLVQFTVSSVAVATSQAGPDTTPMPVSIPQPLQSPTPSTAYPNVLSVLTWVPESAAQLNNLGHLNLPNSVTAVSSTAHNNGGHIFAAEVLLAAAGLIGHDLTVIDAAPVNTQSEQAYPGSYQRKSSREEQKLQTGASMDHLFHLCVQHTSAGGYAVLHGFLPTTTLFPTTSFTQSSPGAIGAYTTPSGWHVVFVPYTAPCLQPIPHDATTGLHQAMTTAPHISAWAGIYLVANDDFTQLGVFYATHHPSAASIASGGIHVVNPISLLPYYLHTLVHAGAPPIAEMESLDHSLHLVTQQRHIEGCRAGGRATGDLSREHAAGTLEPGSARHKAAEALLEGNRAGGRAGGRARNTLYQEYKEDKLVPGTDDYKKMKQLEAALKQPRTQCLTPDDKATIAAKHATWSGSRTALAKTLSGRLGHPWATILGHIKRHLVKIEVNPPTATCKPTKSNKRKRSDGHDGGSGGSLAFLTALASR